MLGVINMTVVIFIASICCKLNHVTARCHAPLSPWSVQPFSVNAF